MSDATVESFLDRTLRNLRGAWEEVSVSTRHYWTGAPRPDLPTDDLEKIRGQMADCLSDKGGEVTARVRAADLGRSYLSLNQTGRHRFLGLLATEFGADHAAVDMAIGRLREAKDEESRRRAERALRAALVPRWRTLLRRFTALPEGVKFLVDLRAELIPFARETPELADLDGDLKDLLGAWFDIGLLELKRITWDAPASLLEKLIAYEAVHAIRSWEDLKNRLDSDRRCFAFIHPNMPDEPLIFVEVALVNGMSDNVQMLLDEEAPSSDPKNADAAIFYSISNAQRGLAGISFGNFLIKRVVDVLKHELPNLKTFATLSPIPGYRRWLNDRIETGEVPALTSSERKALVQAMELGNDATDVDLIRGGLGVDGWWDDDVLSEALKGPLMRGAAHYLSNEKRRSGGAGDPVAHFHLSNGARMERLNWLGDRSANGFRQSCGMMINYLYRLAEIDDNHEAYTDDGRIAQSSQIRGLAKS
ncbi:MAG: malonyl-CoA decarboxylase family protein [Thalassobaculaceae bacterium]|nr:malonyl-CoA decarboxylase family protein [Thalassobaculaceae bacterium]